MRDLKDDLEWLDKCQKHTDLSDDLLVARGQQTRRGFDRHAPDFEYGITFVESTIAREWLERAIGAENEISPPKL